MSNNIYDNFTNLYSISKTLRFELIPQGKTLENMKVNHVIEDDKKELKVIRKLRI